MPAIWTALSASVRGALHEKMDRPNQDAVRVYRAGETLFLAVADGHGNTRSFRSQQGAALATECALEALRDFMWRNGPDAPLSSVRRQMENRLPREIVEAWRRAVRADIARDPFSPLDFAAFPEKAPTLRPNEELPFSGYLAYGATLIVAAVTRRYLAFLQLGDGDILLVHADGQVSPALVARACFLQHANHFHLQRRRAFSFQGESGTAPLRSARVDRPGHRRLLQLFLR